MILVGVPCGDYLCEFRQVLDPMVAIKWREECIIY